MQVGVKPVIGERHSGKRGILRSTPLLLLLPGLLLPGCGRHTAVEIGQGADSFLSAGAAKTGNPQVARYTVTPRTAADITVEFGPTTGYGSKTWTVHANADQPVEMLVAGMRGDATYHMRAVVHFNDGTTVNDTDQSFATGHYPEHLRPHITVESHGNPQPGVELLNPSIGSGFQATVVDLQGNLLWAYEYKDRQSVAKVQFHRYEQSAAFTLKGWGWWLEKHVGMHPAGDPKLWDAKLWKSPPPMRRFATIINPIKPLPNGNFLLVIGLASHALVDGPDGTPPPGTLSTLREINLAGETVYDLPVAELNKRLATIGYKGPQIEMVHHDVEVLPNGHMIVIANGTKVYRDLPGRPGATRVVGDVLVDLDQNFQPVWTWSTFDHLDITRHPMDFPDWTHTNAVVYTKDDGNLLVSMRSQHWVIKVDYRNGHGTGNVIWHLGHGGDFQLIGGHDPEDWQYGEHQPAIFSTNNAGVFDMGVMDNGNERLLADGKVCGTKGAGPCYTTVPIYHIDEAAKTATLVFHDVFPPKQFSLWGGGIQSLANGDVEIDLCNQGMASNVLEVTREEHPQTVWQLHLERSNSYRSERLPSLYPGVQWN
ncbi:hypothetical protein ESZ00_00375 [Silvibacterium dinghuense]|uniref:Arylsulfotransferase N-terminal domain-containing protein n=1 Tax=Silvibacterium dinghuense TaxID=1560006 RepID=A0A4Q1SGH9_9BACT|nr:hypothetical protein ESZ00_00375 [Silvibacterium dinghuense]